MFEVERLVVLESLAQDEPFLGPRIVGVNAEKRLEIGSCFFALSEVIEGPCFSAEGRHIIRIIGQNPAVCGEGRGIIFGRVLLIRGGHLRPIIHRIEVQDILGCLLNCGRIPLGFADIQQSEQGIDRSGLHPFRFVIVLGRILIVLLEIIKPGRAEIGQERIAAGCLVGRDLAECRVIILVRLRGERSLPELGRIPWAGFDRGGLTEKK